MTATQVDTRQAHRGYHLFPQFDIMYDIKPPDGNWTGQVA